MPHKCTFSALPIPLWPAAHKVAWETACSPGGLFAPPKRCDRWAKASWRKARTGYGVWLDWNDRQGILEASSTPASLATPDRVEHYITDLQASRSPYTCVARIEGLHDALCAMDPKGDYGWLANARDHLRASAYPVRSKVARLRMAWDIEAMGFKLMQEAESTPGLPALKRALMFRDGIAIALLIHRPLRMKNFVALKLGKHLLGPSGVDEIVIAGAEMKNGTPFEASIPDHLKAPLLRYLAVHRPTLLARANLFGQARPASEPTELWISSEGRPIDQGAFSRRIKRRCLERLGADLTPHLFRDVAVTSLIVDSPESARLSKSVLGHNDPHTAEKHYNQASMLLASRRYGAMLEHLTSKP